MLVFQGNTNKVCNKKGSPARVQPMDYDRLLHRFPINSAMKSSHSKIHLFKLK